MKKLLLVFTALAISLSLTACKSNALSEKEVALMKIVENWSDDYTSNYSMEGLFVMNIDGNSIEMSMNIDAYDKKSSYISMDTGGLFDMEIYSVINDNNLTTYMYSPFIDTWIREETEIKSMEDIKNATELLNAELYKDLKYIGSEEKDNKVYDVIEVNLNQEMYESLESLTVLINGNSTNASLKDIETFSYKILVAEDGLVDYMILHMEEKNNILDVEFRLYNYGKVEEIIVPQDIIDNAVTAEELMNQ